MAKNLIRIVGDSIVGAACAKAGIPEALDLYASLNKDISQLQSDYGNFLAEAVKYGGPIAIFALTAAVTTLAVVATDKYIKNL
tara:strand:+ start:1216 stop:1464 length:249 start_codon:yes stop_codon:yes gene_type:complete